MPVKASTIAKTGVAVAIVGTVGFFGYEVVKSVTSPSGAGCSQLQSELTDVIKQQFLIYNNSVTYHGGTMTAAQQNQIATLQKEQTSLTAQIGKTCIPPAGQTLQEYLNIIIAGISWTVVALVALGGIVISVRMVRWLIRSWGGGASNPEEPPVSIADARPPATFNPAKVNMDFATGQAINNVDQNIITPEQGTNTLSEVTSTDPLATNSAELSSYISTVAEENISFSELFDFLDSYATEMADIETADAEIAALADAEIAAL